VKYVLRDLPLEAIHPLAMKAAEATHCAGDQGKYWEMHNRLFTNQRELSRPDLTKHACDGTGTLVRQDETGTTTTSAPGPRKPFFCGSSAAC